MDIYYSTVMVGVFVICLFLIRIFTSIREMGFTLHTWEAKDNKPVGSRYVGLAETIREMGFTLDTWRDSKNNLEGRDKGLAETMEDIKTVLEDISKKLEKIENNTNNTTRIDYGK